MKKRTEQDLEYFNTFILVSPDTKAVSGVQPEGETVAAREYRMIGPNPYIHIQSEVLFQVEMDRKGILVTDQNRSDLMVEFLSKPRACLRASGLVRRYGWGIHFDGEGRAALIGMEDQRYCELSSGCDGMKVVAGMRSRRDG